MLWTLNIVPHVVVIPNHTLLHNYNFVTVMNCNVNIWYADGLRCPPRPRERAESHLYYSSPRKAAGQALTHRPWGVLPTDWLPIVCSAGFLIQPRTTSPLLRWLQLVSSWHKTSQDSQRLIYNIIYKQYFSQRAECCSDKSFLKSS
jgi:hypothetical protein